MKERGGGNQRLSYRLLIWSAPVWVVGLAGALLYLFPGLSEMGYHGPSSPKGRRRAPVRRTRRPAFRTTQRALGTLVRIRIPARYGAARARAAMAKAMEEVLRLQRILGPKGKESDPVRLNAAAGAKPVKVRPETVEVLTLAGKMSSLTGGAFDVTWAALAPLWRFRSKKPEPPSMKEISARLPLVDWRKLRVDRKGGTASLPRKGMRVGLGAIAKGWIVGRAATRIRGAGVRDFVINAGGDLFASGEARPGRAWRVGIRHPRAKGRVLARLLVKDRAVMTSGDYEQVFVKDGKRYHHIIDPRSGRPARGLSSVTVVTRDPARADALATGLLVLGPERARRLTGKLPETEVILVETDGRVFATPGLRGILILTGKTGG